MRFRQQALFAHQFDAQFLLRGQHQLVTAGEEALVFAQDGIPHDGLVLSGAENDADGRIVLRPAPQVVPDNKIKRQSNSGPTPQVVPDTTNVLLLSCMGLAIAFGMQMALAYYLWAYLPFHPRDAAGDSDRRLTSF